MTEGSGLIRILAVDDHPLVRKGIVGLVADEPDMTTVAEASNGREAIQQFRIHRPDVTLMDLQMPEMNGLDAIMASRPSISGICKSIRVTSGRWIRNCSTASRPLEASATSVMPD